MHSKRAYLQQQTLKLKHMNDSSLLLCAGRFLSSHVPRFVTRSLQPLFSISPVLLPLNTDPVVVLVDA